MKVAIVTAVYGLYDEPKQLPHDIEVPAYLFTDNYELALRAGDRGWHAILDEYPTGDKDQTPMLNAKYIKTHPLVAAPNADVSIWLDGSMSIVIDRFVERCLEALGDDDIAMTSHPLRTCITTEAHVTASLLRYADCDPIKQVDFYRSIGHPLNWGLFASGASVRRHNDKVESWGNHWWDDCVNHTYQDQLSLPVITRLMEQERELKVEQQHAVGAVVGDLESRDLTPGITVVIPSIPPRRHLLQRAVASAINQIYPAAAISVAVDLEKKGAWHTRNRALRAVRTEWTAFLDDDDEFLPEHLNILNNNVVNHGADMAYSWFNTVPHGCDPFPTWFADAPWDQAAPRHTTIVMLVRTSLAQSICFTPPTSGDPFGNEDWRFILELNARGKIVHAPQRTWLWHHDSGNTSGRPERW